MPTPEAALQQLCLQHGWTVAIAESCTGGLIAHRLTNRSGSSGYFVLGIVAYANQAKTRVLGVPAALVRRHGAVSAPVARRMARGVRSRARATVSVAVTGIAGPTGGTPEKPVGTVFIAVASVRATRVSRHRFRGTRTQIKRRTTDAALRILLQHIRHRDKIRNDNV